MCQQGSTKALGLEAQEDEPTVDMNDAGLRFPEDETSSAMGNPFLVFYLFVGLLAALFDVSTIPRVGLVLAALGLASLNFNRIDRISRNNWVYCRDFADSICCTIANAMRP